MFTVMFILQFWSTIDHSYGKGLGREKIATALIEAVEECVSDGLLPTEFQDAQELLNTMAYYVAKESNVSEYPIAFSWDAKAGVSCGILQEPCAFVKTHSLKEQGIWWIKSVHDAGLASVDSDPKRAKARKLEVKKVLEKIQKQETLQPE
jgi:hypothetical protein